VAAEVAVSFRLEGALWFLLLVPVAGALLVHAYRARARASERFGHVPQLKALAPERDARLGAIRGVVWVLGLAALIVAWAGPQYGSQTRMLQKRGIDVVVALDFSKSMLAKDVRPSRIERAKAELVRLFGELTGDRVGVVAFAGDTLEFPMTTDYGAIETFLRDLGPYDMPVGGTAIGRALIASKRLLERGARPPSDEPEAERETPGRAVILITDGEDHEGDPVTAAEELVKSGAQVFVIGVGSRTGEPIPTYAPDGTWTGYLRGDDGKPVLSALTSQNEAQLQRVASVGRGKYFRAREGSVGIEEIRALMRGMKQAEHSARKVTIAEDRYALVLLIGFLLVLAEALLPEGRVARARRAGGES
jgi:Ca-activated chloride channel homolog